MDNLKNITIVFGRQGSGKSTLVKRMTKDLNVYTTTEDSYAITCIKSKITEHTQCVIIEDMPIGHQSMRRLIELFAKPEISIHTPITRFISTPKLYILIQGRLSKNYILKYGKLVSFIETKNYI